MPEAKGWWGLPGPSRYVGEAVAGTAGGDGVGVFDVPFPRPRGLVEAISDRFANDYVVNRVDVDATRIDGRSIAHEMLAAAGLGGVGIGAVAEFVRFPALSEVVFIVEGITQADVVRWALFLGSLQTERRKALPIGGPYVVVLLPNDLPRPDKAKLAGKAGARRFEGFVTRVDTLTWMGMSGFGSGHDLMERVALSTTVEVAAWSHDLMEALCHLDHEDQIDPLTCLREMASGHGWEKPTWSNGLVDLWDDVPTVHAAAGMAHGRQHEIERRVWAGQSMALMPFVDAVRRCILTKYIDRLSPHATPVRPFQRTLNGTVIPLSSAWEFEFPEIKQLVWNDMTVEERFLASKVWTIRREVAHMKSVETSLIRETSQAWGAVRDKLLPP